MSDGFCACGCGERTPVIRRTDRSKGRIRGEHSRYVFGHAHRPRNMEPYEVRDCGHTTPCWVWSGSIANGYGRIMREGRAQNAHRWYYEQTRGPLPSHAVLDHLCRNTRCVNPAHVEPVTNAENTRRGERAKLTYADVAAIRALRAQGWTQKALAERYGVVKATIGNIEHGRTWTAAGGRV